MRERKQSFLEKLIGTKTVFDDEEISPAGRVRTEENKSPTAKPWSPAVYQEREDKEDTEEDHLDTEEDIAEEDEVAGLAIDMYESDNELVIQGMIAGVTPENLHIDITHNTVTIEGVRIAPQGIPEEHYIGQELYWGPFLRKIKLPYEIDVDGAEAIEKYGLLIIRLPRLDKSRSQQLKVKSI